MNFTLNQHTCFSPSYHHCPHVTISMRSICHAIKISLFIFDTIDVSSWLWGVSFSTAHDFIVPFPLQILWNNPKNLKWLQCTINGLCVGVRKHLFSVNYRTNAWVDLSDFSVTYCGWLEEGSFRWSAPPLIQGGCYGRHLGFDFRRLEDKRLGRLIRFVCGLLGVTTGRFFSMISSAAHPRSFPSIR
jgi:hypothetical protein